MWAGAFRPGPHSFYALPYRQRRNEFQFALISFTVLACSGIYRLAYFGRITTANLGNFLLGSRRLIRLLWGKWQWRLAASRHCHSSLRTQVVRGVWQSQTPNNRNGTFRLSFTHRSWNEPDLRAMGFKAEWF